MIRLMKTRDGQQAQELTEYPENWDMNDAMEELTKRYRTELSEKDSTMYLESLQIELDLLNEGLDEVEDAEQIESNKKYVNNIDWRGAGYYSTDGDCLLLDGELKSYIHEDVWTWELVEAPSQEDEVEPEPETEYGVYKILSGGEETGQWGICRKNEFEKVNLCECYDNNGFKLGCTNAGCDTGDNEYYKDQSPSGEHNTAMAFSFWDGHNWKSLVLSADTNWISDVEEETELAEKLLKIWDGISFNTNAPTDEVVKDGYKLTHSNYAGNPWDCVIEEG